MSAISPTAGRRSWRAPAVDCLSAVLGLWLAVAVVYWPSAAALDAIWRGSAGDAYTHGYLVLIASLWLLLRDRARLAATPISPVGWWAWAVVVLMSGAWLWSWRAAIQVLHVLLVPGILLAVLVAALGWRVARLVLPPIGLLLFAMPVWDAINGILQTLSARVNGILIWLSGLPAYMQGDVIRLPAGSIEIAQACSGLSAFVIGLTVAALYGELVRDSLRRRLAWLGLMGLLALITNAVRVFIVTVVAYESDMRSSLVMHHVWLGWCLFAIAVGTFLAIAARLGETWDRKRSLEARLGEARAGQGRPAHACAPEVGRMSVARLAVTLACLGLLPALAYGMDFFRSQTSADVIIHGVEPPPGWRGPIADSASDWSPRFASSSAASLLRYDGPGAESVEVFAVAYRNQTQEAKLLAYSNDLLGSQERLRPQAERIVDSPAGRWREIVAVAPTGARSLIWSRYRIGERLFVEPRLSQLWYGVAALTGSPVSSLTALRAVCGLNCAAARQELSAAAAELQPSITLRLVRRSPR